MGEMLQEGGNPWRGMVYGMTGLVADMADPRPYGSCGMNSGCRGAG